MSAIQLKGYRSAFDLLHDIKKQFSEVARVQRCIIADLAEINKAYDLEWYC